MSTSADPARLAAVVLTGGTGARLGGVEKASLLFAGTTLLEHALAASSAASEVVVVGERQPTSRPVRWTREDPPGGGPAAGVLAGIDSLSVRPDLVWVLAVDMPRVTPSTVDRLLGALDDEPGADVALLVDADEEPQPLAGVYRYDALVAARPESRRDEPGLSMRRLLAPLRIVAVAAVGDEAHDVDTWADLGE